MKEYIHGCEVPCAFLLKPGTVVPTFLGKNSLGLVFFYLGVSHLLINITFLPPLPVQLNHTQPIHSFSASIAFLDF